MERKCSPMWKFGHTSAEVSPYVQIKFFQGGIHLRYLQPVSLSAQEARGTILGRVSDASGAVVVGARVEGLNTATGVRSAATANESGDYVLPYLNPGPYTVTVDAPGFKKFTQTQITLRMDDRMTVDAVMQVGQASESVGSGGFRSVVGYIYQFHGTGHGYENHPGPPAAKR